MYNLKNLEKYLTKDEIEYCINILQQYDANVDDSHNSKHIIPVINTIIKLQKYHEQYTDIRLCIFIALLHDIGLTINPNRKIHHLTSKEYVMKDNTLKQFFNEDEINIIANAVYEHRSSIKEKSSLYSMLISDADTLAGYNIRKIIKRMIIFYRSSKNDYNNEQLLNIMYDHLVNKYGKNGYNSFCLPETIDESYTNEKEIMYFINNKNRFISLAKEFI